MLAQANDCFNCKIKASFDQILLAEGPFYNAYFWLTYNIMIGGP